MGVAPAEIARVLAPTMQALDMSTSTIDQAAVAISLEGVDWERRPSELRAVYATLMTAMVDRLAEVLSHGSVCTRPTDRIFVWAPLADGWSTSALLERAVQHGMLFMPGSVFFADVDDEVSLRLSISNHTPETIAGGMRRLAAAIAAAPALAG